jgi:hypothetical protein
MITVCLDNFGTANLLKCTDLLPVSPRRTLGKYDPALMREAIGVPEIRERLFPTIQSGVRFWPYLLVAHQLRDEHSRLRIEKTLQGLRRRQRTHQDKGRYTRSFGPRSATTFAPYRSMYRNIMATQHVNAADLRSMLSMRSRYGGHPEFFLNNAHEWRKALRRSMGHPGQQFARLLDSLYKEDSDSSIVDRAITELLRKPGYDQWLRRGAFCYAFLRCVYGITTSIQGIRSFVAVSEWARLLARVLAKPPAPLSQYRRFLPLVEASIEKPALEHLHRRARADNGIVLASLGFHVFYNLYVAHSPQGTV